MKTVKIMLVAITALTIAGGALAFKVAKFSKNYCTRSSPGICTSYATALKVVTQPNGVIMYAVETTDTENCTKTSAPDCGTISIRVEPN